MKPVYQTVNQERRYTVYRPVVKTEHHGAAVHRAAAGLSDGQPGAAVHRHEGGLPDRAPRAALYGHEAGLPDRQPGAALHRHEAGLRDDDGRPAVHRLPAGDDRVARRSRSAATTSGSTRWFPGRSSSGRCAFRSRRRPAIRAGSSVASTSQKVTATVAVQCPPRMVSQRVFVSRPVVRNVSETRYVRETMVRQVPVTTCRYVAEERVETIPVTTCQYVAEERVEPYEVRTCQYVPEERVETIPVTTCQYVAEEHVEPYEVRKCEMVAEERSRDDPRHHLPVRRRGARRALRGAHLPVRCRGAGRDDPGHDLPVRRRAAGRASSRDDLPDGGRDGLAPGAGLGARGGPGHREPVRGPGRAAPDRRAANDLVPVVVPTCLSCD